MRGWEVVVVGGHPIITNQKETGGSCHRNLVHGSRGPSHHTRRIAYHIMIIISFLRQKGKKKEGGRVGGGLQTIIVLLCCWSPWR